MQTRIMIDIKLFFHLADIFERKGVAPSREMRKMSIYSFVRKTRIAVILPMSFIPIMVLRKDIA